MTSKRALEFLKSIVKDFFGDFEKQYTPQDFGKWTLKATFETIQKDLEVLDILREYFSYSKYSYWYVELSESDFDYEGECTKEEWENSPQKKIKDWLKRTEDKE